MRVLHFTLTQLSIEVAPMQATFNVLSESPDISLTDDTPILTLLIVLFCK